MMLMFIVYVIETLTYDGSALFQFAMLFGGAYMAQEIVTHEKTQELGGMTYNMVKNQLRTWSKEIPELREVVGDVVWVATEVVKEGDSNE